MQGVLCGAFRAATVPAAGGPLEAVLEHSPPPRRHVPACVWLALTGPIDGLAPSASSFRPQMLPGTVCCLVLPNNTVTAPRSACWLDRSRTRPLAARLPACCLPGCRKERYLAYRGSLMYAGVARVCAEHRPDLTTLVEVTAYRSPAAGGRPITVAGANLTKTLQACDVWHVACARRLPPILPHAVSPAASDDAVAGRCWAHQPPHCPR